MIIDDIAERFTIRHLDAFDKNELLSNTNSMLISDEDFNTICQYIDSSPMINASLIMNIFSKHIIKNVSDRYSDNLSSQEMLAMGVNLKTIADSLVAGAIIKVIYMQTGPEIPAEWEEALNEWEEEDELVEEPFKNLDFEIEWPPTKQIKF